MVVAMIRLLVINLSKSLAEDIARKESKHHWQVFSATTVGSSVHHDDCSRCFVSYYEQLGSMSLTRTRMRSAGLTYTLKRTYVIQRSDLIGKDMYKLFHNDKDGFFSRVLSNGARSALTPNDWARKWEQVRIFSYNCQQNIPSIAERKSW